MVNSEQDIDPEITAIQVVHEALRGLAPDAQSRVLAYVTQKLKIDVKTDSTERRALVEDDVHETLPPSAASQAEEDHIATDELEGISPIAKKWIQRSKIKS